MSAVLQYDTRSRARLKLDTPAAASPDWKAQAISTYLQRRQHAGSSLRQALARQVQRLTGRELDGDYIWVDPQGEAAFATVDGIRFRLSAAGLQVLRPCAHCGIGEFASPAIESVADLGHALADWEPHHPACEAEDPYNWLESDDPVDELQLV